MELVDQILRCKR